MQCITRPHWVKAASPRLTTAFVRDYDFAIMSTGSADKPMWRNFYLLIYLLFWRTSHANVNATCYGSKRHVCLGRVTLSRYLSIHKLVCNLHVTRTTQTLQISWWWWWWWWRQLTAECDTWKCWISTTKMIGDKSRDKPTVGLRPPTLPTFICVIVISQ